MASSPDVLVIGGGIVGAASAYHLARRGASVTLLEAEQLAYGATGRNLGYIWIHTRRPGPELELVMHLRRELEELPGVFDDDFDLRTEGGLIYAHTEAQLATLAEFVAIDEAHVDTVGLPLLDEFGEGRELRLGMGVDQAALGPQVEVVIEDPR